MLDEYKDLEIYFNYGAETLVFRNDLHKQDSTSDKVYIITITKIHQTGHYSLGGLYGRRGNRLVKHHKGTYSSESAALFGAHELQKEKLKNGYKNLGVINKAAGGNFASTPQPAVSSDSDDIKGLLNNMKFKIGAVDVKDWTKNRRAISNILNHDAFMIEPYDENAPDPFYYVKFEDSKDHNAYGFSVFKMDGGYSGFIKLSNTGLPIPMKEIYYDNALALFLGYDIGGNNLALFDIYRIGTGDDVSSKQWKVRRAMLTSVYEQLFPNVDPYDINNRVYLNDYIYEDKENHIIQEPGTYIARQVGSTSMGRATMFTAK